MKGKEAEGSCVKLICRTFSLCLLSTGFSCNRFNLGGSHLFQGYKSHASLSCTNIKSGAVLLK